MATKKTTASPKKSTATKAKKTTAKAKSTTKGALKKVAPKKAVKKSVAPKKKVPNKKSVVPKNSPKKATRAKTKATSSVTQKATSALSSDQWKGVVGATFSAFPTLWWRVGIVNMLALVLMVVGVGLATAIFILMSGGIGSLENLFANMRVTGVMPDSSVIFSFSAALIFWIVWVVVFGIIAKISSFMIVKSYAHKAVKNPLTVFFQESWSLFWSWAWLGLKIFWYIVWPLLLFSVFVGIIGVSAGIARIGEVNQGLEVGLLAVIMALVGLFIFAITFYRGTKVIFSQAALVHGGAPASKAMNTSLSLLEGNWWRVFGGLLGFFALIALVQVIINIPAIMGDIGRLPEGMEGLYIASSLLDFLFNFFILAPLAVTFIYFLMLQVAKNKGIKI